MFETQDCGSRSSGDSGRLVEPQCGEAIVAELEILNSAATNVVLGSTSSERGQVLSHFL